VGVTTPEKKKEKCLRTKIFGKKKKKEAPLSGKKRRTQRTRSGNIRALNKGTKKKAKEPEKVGGRGKTSFPPSPSTV